MAPRTKMGYVSVLLLLLLPVILVLLKVLAADQHLRDSAAPQHGPT